jgi:hypothetical protein
MNEINLLHRVHIGRIESLVSIIIVRGMNHRIGAVTDCQPLSVAIFSRMKCCNFKDTCSMNSVPGDIRFESKFSNPSFVSSFSSSLDEDDELVGEEDDEEEDDEVAFFAFSCSSLSSFAARNLLARC